jgi:hypothetical protein
VLILFILLLVVGGVIASQVPSAKYLVTNNELDSYYIYVTIYTNPNSDTSYTLGAGWTDITDKVTIPTSKKVYAYSLTGTEPSILRANQTVFVFDTPPTKDTFQIAVYGVKASETSTISFDKLIVQPYTTMHGDLTNDWLAETITFTFPQD